MKTGNRCQSQSAYFLLNIQETYTSCENVKGCLESILFENDWTVYFASSQADSAEKRDGA